MRDPGRTRESCRAHHQMPRRGGCRAVQRIALEPPIHPWGWARAYDGAELEHRPPEGSRWDGMERRRGDRRRERGGQGRDERRRGIDRRGLLAHARDFATRFKEPLIGIGVAAMAMPAIRATTPRPETAPAAPAEHATATPEANAAAAAASQPDRDMDAEVGARWSNVERSNTIDAAVNTYRIDPELAANIYDHAKNEGVEPKLAYGLVKTESSFKHTAVSPVGARGLTQLMPGTARWLQPGTTPADLFKPDVSLQVGFRYLRHLLDRYNGDQHLALTAYNRGPGTVDRAVHRGRDPDNGYARAVLGNSLRGTSGATSPGSSTPDRQTD